MIDHVVARRLAATAMDLPLEADDANELDGHLATCPACRNVSAALTRDAAALRHLDFGPVPVAVRADVAIAAERGRSSPVRRWLGLVVVGALLVIALGSGVLGVGGSVPADPDAAGVADPAIHWQTDVIGLQASDMWIQTAAGRFAPPATQPALTASADAGSRTLEVLWGDGVASRGIRLILVDVEGAWLVKGVQALDGATGAWLDSQGPFLGASIGNGEVGDVDLDLVDAQRAGAPVVGHLHLGDLVLKVAPRVPVDPNMPAPAPRVGVPPVRVPPTPVLSTDPNDGIPPEDTPTP